MARMILPKLAGAKPSAKPSKGGLSDEDMETLLGGGDSPDEGAEVPEEQETAADEAAETPEEQAEEAATGTELHDPNTFATQAAADASECRGYEAQLQQYVDDNPDDDAAADALKECTEHCEAAESAAEEARAAAEDGDLGKAAEAAQRAHDACEEASKMLGGVLGHAAAVADGDNGAAADEGADIPEADAPEGAPGATTPGMSSMAAWLSKYGR